MSKGGELSWIVNDLRRRARGGRSAERAASSIDFTGYTCTNCRWMEANMFTRAGRDARNGRYVRVRLYTDGQGELYKRFQQMEQTMFGTVALPYYAVLEPDGRPVVAFGGLTRSPEEYVAFLREGLH